MSKRVNFALAALATLVLAAPAAAWAHAFLRQASPAAGAVLHTAPSVVRIELTERLEAAFSRIAVTNDTGLDVTQGAIHVEGAVMWIALRPLARGAYDVRWRALSVDTHQTEGTYRFTIQ